MGLQRSRRWCSSHAMAALFSLVLLLGTGRAGDVSPYVLGPEDQITIRALDAEEISDKPFTVDNSGFVTLPMLGRVKAAGLTVPQLETTIADRLKQFLWQPQVAITVSEFHSQPVSVIGAVNTPGVQQLRGRKTLVEALSSAGGLRPDAGHEISIQRRIEQGAIPLPGAHVDSTGEFSLAKVSLPEIMNNIHPEENITVKANDVISVPRGDVIYVVGEVKKSGGFPMDERETLSVLKALSLSEGLLPTASMNGVRIIRSGAPGTVKQEIPVDLKKILSGKGEDIGLRPDDILFVPASVGKKAAVRGIEAAIQLATGVVIWRH